MFKFLTHSILLACITVTTSCSTINIQEVEQEELDITVNIIQQVGKTNIDIFLSRGLWQQPVSMNGDEITATFANQEVTTLANANRSGRYGLHLSEEKNISSISVENIGKLKLPLLTPVQLSAGNSFEGQSFFKDDVLILDLPEANGQERYIVTTGFCNNDVYTSALKISPNKTTVEILLGDIMRNINYSAEADLHGVIPITLALEEHYTPLWPEPFKPGKLVSRDESHFRVDTSGFRFKGSVAVRVSKNFSFQLQNQSWDVKYCY